MFPVDKSCIHGIVGARSQSVTQRQTLVTFMKNSYIFLCQLDCFNSYGYFLKVGVGLLTKNSLTLDKIGIQVCKIRIKKF